MRAEDTLCDVEASLLLGVSLTLRLVELLLLGKLAGDGVGGVGDDLGLLLLDVRQLLGGLPCPLHLLFIDLFHFFKVALHLHRDFQTFRHLGSNTLVMLKGLGHSLVKRCKLVQCLLSDEIGNQCFVCHISIAL